MDLFDVAKACARRWYILLPMLVVVLYYSYSTYMSVKPVYYSSATIGMASSSVNPVPAGNEVRTNALMNSGGVQLITNLLALGLSDARVREQVVAQGGLPDYSAKVFTIPGAQLPLVTIEATSPDPELVMKTINIATAAAGPALEDVQRIRVFLTTSAPPVRSGSPGTPVPALPSRTRSTATVFVGGLSRTRGYRDRPLRRLLATPDEPTQASIRNRDQRQPRDRQFRGRRCEAR